MAPDSGGDAWVIFDLGEVYEITKFISWDLHHGNWWLEYSADKTNWSNFASGQTSWQNESCQGNVYDISSSPANIRYIRYRIVQVTGVGNAYRIAWFSFMSNTPSTLHPGMLYQTILSGGSIKCGSSDPRECTTGKNQNPIAYTADPINTLTGGYDYSVGDLNIQTAAGPLIFQRSYTSSALRLNLYTPAIDTTLGYGWTHNQDIRLVLTQPDKVWFKAQSANQYLFTKNPDNSYTPHAGVTASLRFDSLTSQYILVDAGQSTSSSHYE